MMPTPSHLPVRLAATALFATLSLAASVAATVNLAQSNRIVAPAPADARRLSTYFSPPYKSGPLPSAVEEILLRNAPADLRAGCAAMVDSWGGAARGSSRVTLRILSVAGGSAWVTYRCDSRLAQFDGNYSERLADFNSARGTIQFLDLKTNEDSAATLYHVGLAATLKLRGAENSASFVVFAISFNPAAGEPVQKSGRHSERSLRSEESRDSSQAQNDTVGFAQSFPGGSTSRDASAAPSQDGPAAQDRAASNGPAENRLVVIANSATTTKPVLSLITARKRPGAQIGDTANGDASDVDEYRAGLRYEHDLAGYLTAVGVYYRDAPPGARSRFGVVRYVWNPATLTFAAAAPVPIHRLKRGLPSYELRPHHPPVDQTPFERLPSVPGYHPPSH
jgi:hypothetical protein